jgi:hypothetical protein
MQKTQNKSELLTITDVCDFLHRPRTTVQLLVEMGLLAVVRRQHRKFYPRDALTLTKKLLQFAEANTWSVETLGAFADLYFAAGATASLWTRLSPMPATYRHWIYLPSSPDMLAGIAGAVKGSDSLFNGMLYCVSLLASLWPSPFATTGFAELVDLIRHNNPTAWHDQIKMFNVYGSALFAGLVNTFTQIAQPVSIDLTTLLETLVAAPTSLSLYALLDQVGLSAWSQHGFPLPEAMSKIEELLALCAAKVGYPLTGLICQLYRISSSTVGWGNAPVRIRFGGNDTRATFGKADSQTIIRAADFASQLELLATYPLNQTPKTFKFQALTSYGPLYGPRATPFLSPEPRNLKELVVSIAFYHAVRQFPLLLWSDLTLSYPSVESEDD